MMAQASTPNSVTSKVQPANSNTLVVSWLGPIDNGNDKFSIQFVSRNNSGGTPVPAPGQPEGGFPVTATGNSYSQALTFASPTDASNYAAQFQAQVQALADEPNTASNWGLQAWWNVGFSLTITVGSTEITLNQLPGMGVYRLPVSKEDPLSVTYADLSKFVETMDSDLKMPTTFPNGAPITASLNITECMVDTINRTFAFDVSATLGKGWEIFPGLTFNAIGLDIQRTNGSYLMAA
ncbi:hypothetical protein [Massilia sp. YIM B04103]|uniref:hypothetical protein n=1 Tax=Massilia sp. YIM B04103 TaxID=2963106 RepID=UPI00210E196B|nr:hypothetical protein [Massilia sp. YIM B04103]